MMVHSLKCNNLKCHQNVKKITLVTTCGHIFCYKCSSAIKKIMKCIACQTFLKEADITIKEIDKRPCLQGFSPEIILEESRKGISFWFYQIYEELEIIKVLSEKSSENLIKDYEFVKGELQKCTIDRDFLSQKLKKTEEALERERLNIYELQNIVDLKNKEIQNIGLINEKLKYGVRNFEKKIYDNSKNNDSLELNRI